MSYLGHSQFGVLRNGLEGLGVEKDELTDFLDAKHVR
jgi:hypothetical protein